MAQDSIGKRSARTEQRTQTKVALAAMLVPIFFVTMFAACIIGTYHKPVPNGIKVAVVGPTKATERLRSQLAMTVGSEFEISVVRTTAAAAQDVRQRGLDAAFVPATNPKRPATVYVAEAGGRLVATAAETLARSITAAEGIQLVVHDVRPLAPGDAIGLGVFMFLIVCTIGGYLASTILGTAAPKLSARRRYAFIGANAILVPTIVFLIAGLALGTYTGSFGAILAFIAVGALYVLSIGVVTRLLQVVVGPAALFISLTIFVFLNIPSLGATYTPTMLPSFWKFINHYWIGGQAVNAERGILYFGGLGVGSAVLRVLAWTGVAVVVLLLLRAPRLTRTTSTRASRAAAPHNGTTQEATQGDAVDPILAVVQTPSKRTPRTRGSSVV